MLQFIWLIPLFPLLGFLLLALGGKYYSKKLVAFIGSASVGISAILTFVIGLPMLQNIEGMPSVTNVLYTWINVGSFSVPFSFRIDALSLVFVFVITFVGFLIHVYSTEYMAHEEGYSRFFAYMNLFVASMLILVMADSLLLMYLGWEGVGLCSYLLIGFFYRDSANNYAARKAFIVTRVGDTAMLIGLLMLVFAFNTLDMAQISDLAKNSVSISPAFATTVALLLLGGAVGKSAQLPLQVWLPDAMAGPSPVSALIHAATMVTAGVYLIARMHVVFMLSPFAMLVVASIGAITLLIAGVSALYQTDLKRVLAYSTISQIGYMFLALGVGAWSAAVFHFMIHGFFKALLFLGAGAVILSLHHQQDMFKMGGLYKKMPVIFWTFLIGSASLAAFPFISAGFFSKDAIIWYALSSPQGGWVFWLAAMIGAIITCLYTFRMIYVTFFGKEKTHVHYTPGIAMTLPLIILAILSTVAGYIELPHNMGHIQWFSSFVTNYLPGITVSEHFNEWVFQSIAMVLSLGALAIAFKYYNEKYVESFTMTPIKLFFQNGWNFDKLYDTLFVKPFVWISNASKDDAVDRGIDNGAIQVSKLSNRLSVLQNGRVGWYLAAMVIGIILVVSLMLFIKL
jgi:NADH-quinone oxidoreductase subunit L